MIWTMQMMLTMLTTMLSGLDPAAPPPVVEPSIVYHFLILVTLLLEFLKVVLVYVVSAVEPPGCLEE
jgi:hypothetical protein